MSTDLKRIDPKTIPALFAKHGMRPRQHAFCCELTDGTQCCCINTILVADKVGRVSAITKAERLEDYDDAEILAEWSCLSPDYAEGLAYGWDDAPVPTSVRTELGLAGVEDGQAAWEACQGALIQPDESFPDDDPTSPRSLAERIAYENDDPALQH